MSFASHLESRRVAEGALGPMWTAAASRIVFGADGWAGWNPQPPSSSVANSNGILMGLPWTCRKDVTVSGLSVYISTAAAAGSGSLVRMGLFDDGGVMGQAGVPLADAGSAGIESVGMKDLAFGSNYQMLRGNTYWALALWLVAGATNPSMGAAASGYSGWMQAIDLGSNNWDNAASFLYTPAVATGALPNPAPTMTGNGLGAVQRPLLGAKVVSVP